ncbi:MAG: sensor histidine kinase [Drouetiella hepatica Uher 2000/2452]|jgi:signal transduction histidine kinase|uniref:Sensor histidine kinase n=1 Tax=Drouetiella hepatica Uher 2000/2452 TaxID=904376 RepID=A0A951UM77_9CYAN|nr:sensor histidine kinase [Drouetiella hepatica Uher 2000/2452]
MTISYSNTQADAQNCDSVLPACKISSEGKSQRRFQSETHSPELSLESTLAELPLHHCQVSDETLGKALAQVFERYPALPGAILLEGDRFLGMISRQRLLEFLIRPQGMAFLQQPLSVLYSYARSCSLILPATTSIMVAAQMALRRSPQERNEPIIVQSHELQNHELQNHEPQTYQLLDVHELNIAYWQIRGLETQVRYERAQVQMIQTEKMASLGRLVDGVAHEILDPVGFIWGNLVHVSHYTSQILTLLEAYEQHLPEVPAAIAQIQEDIELSYLRQDLPQTLISMRTGADRLKKLSASLQNFCHIDEVYPKPTNLHECLDSILLLLKSRLSSEIEIVRHYGHLPPIACYAGQLNQVFINILTNAVDALLNRSVRQGIAAELGQQPASRLSKARIVITTQVLAHSDGKNTARERWVSIRIADNGSGVSPDKREQILASFSTEQRAAKETSLGVSYQIVTAKHGGKLNFRSLSPELSPETLGAETLGAETSSPGTLSQGSAGDSDVDFTEMQSGTEFEILLPLV